MNKQKIIKAVEQHIKTQFAVDSSGHDWWHIDRVRRTALILGKKEKADQFIVELGALLHDIADFKFHDGDEKAGGRAATKLLAGLDVDTDVITAVAHIVDNVSFKGSHVANKMNSIEGKVVQDADRLDAIGAVGIARTFAYGGWKGKRPIYDPKGKVHIHKTFNHYKRSSDSTVHHVYEKLLLLKDKMNTQSAKRMASARHKFMEKYLEQFFDEWNGKR